MTVCTTSCVPSDHHDPSHRSGVGLGPAPAGLLPPPQPPPLGTRRISFATVPHRPDHNARPAPVDNDNSIFTPGSLTDPSILIRPASPTTPFEFPFQFAEETYCGFNVSGGPPCDSLRDSVTHVVGLPRVCGLSLDTDLVIRISRATTSSDAWDNPSLMDGGANICLIGILDLLVDVVPITPLPISVATKLGNISMDDCCTKKGLIPLSLMDGSVYSQPCYYCKNAVETIISPQAILAASDVLVTWTQTGHKDGSPGMIRFDSDSGLHSITMGLEYRDGLYYCPTDVFTLDRDPIRCHGSVIHRALVPPDPVKRRYKDYIPVSHNRLTESELWMLRLGSPGEDQLDLLPGKVTGIPPGFQYHPF